MRDQDWIDRLASQYGTQQRAALRGDDAGARAANNWIHRIADDHWHEIIAALRILRASGALRTELCVTNVKNKGTKNERTID